MQYLLELSKAERYKEELEPKVCQPPTETAATFTLKQHQY